MGADIIADDKENWVLEYPILIAPYVDDYYGCLKSGEKIAGPGYRFEPQHRADIGLCIDSAERNQKAANAILEERDWVKYASPAKVAAIFATIRAVHVSRGRDLDTRIAKSLARSAAQYSAEMHPDYSAGTDQAVTP